DDELRTRPESSAEPSSTRGRDLVLGSVAAVAGVALLLVGTTVLDRAAMGVRVALGVLGLCVAYQAIRLVARGIARRNVDVSLGLSITWVTLLVGAAVLAPLLPLGEHVNTAKTIDVASYLRPDLFS